MSDLIRFFFGTENVFLRCCRVFFVTSLLISMAMLGWIDDGWLFAAFPEASFSIISLFAASGLTIGSILLMRITTGTCHWLRCHVLCDMRLLHRADPEHMTSAQRTDFERMKHALGEFDVAMGTAVAGLALLLISSHLADPTTTAQSVADLLGAIGSFSILLWLAAGGLVLRCAERGRYGRRLALTLHVRRGRRLKKLPILSRLQRRHIVRRHHRLRAA